MVHASNHTEEKYVATYRTQAATYATAALKIDARDSNAIKAHRLLGASMEAAHHTPAPAALAAIGDGNALLETGQYAQAALKYEAAIRIDPAYGAAWRSLYDALAAQEKFSDAQAAALGALATMPSVKPNWHRVAESMERAGRPLSTFLWRARAGVTPQGIEIDPGAPESDSAAWMAYALSLAVEESGPPFARELAAWNSTLQIIGEMGSTAKIHDPGLRDMIRFNAGGQLKAALFALHYNEAWRAEFEAWKKAGPDGLKRFVETFRTGL